VRASTVAGPFFVLKPEGFDRPDRKAVYWRRIFSRVGRV